MGRGNNDIEPNGNNSRLMGVLRGDVITVDGREYAWEPVFSPGDEHFFCGRHRPDNSKQLEREEVVTAVETWLNSDREKLNAEGNFTRFPVRPPQCEDCDRALVWENRTISLA